mmetsp:Transcript_60694/g.132806  ORF Transcript_60694/g.132806 Transcript_60694/m.132806 type:complete len:82 (-) Transcript_60694:7-252(-)
MQFLLQQVSLYRLEWARTAAAARALDISCVLKVVVAARAVYSTCLRSVAAKTSQPKPSLQYQTYPGERQTPSQPGSDKAST